LELAEKRGARNNDYSIHFYDYEKYVRGYRVLREAVSPELVAPLFEHLSDYRVILVPFSGVNLDYIVEIVRSVKGWEKVETHTLGTLIVKEAKTLEKLGIPPYIVALDISNVNVEETSRLSVGGSLGAVEVSGGYERATVRSVEAGVSSRTLRALMKILLESVDSPTVVVLSKPDVDFLGAELVAGVAASNPNLVFLVQSPNEYSREYASLYRLPGSWSLNVPLYHTTFKNHIINVYTRVRDELNRARLPWKKARRNLAATIDLLIETGILRRQAGIFLSRLVSPVLVFEALNRFVAMMYAHLDSPTSLLDEYHNADNAGKAMIRAELLDAAERYAAEAEMRVVGEAIGAAEAENALAILLEDEVEAREVLWAVEEGENPPESPTLYAAAKLGVVSLRYGRTKEVKPGIRYLYDYVRERTQ